MPEIKLYIAIFLIVIVVFAIIIKKISIVEAAVMMVPFRAVSFDVGLNFSFGQILCFLSLLILLVTKPARLVVNGWLSAYLIYCVIATTIASVFFVDSISTLGGNFFRGDGRFLSQIVLKLFFMYSVVFIVSNSIKSMEDIRSLVKKFMLAVSVLATLGLLQFVVYYLFNTDIFPISNLSDLEKARTSVFTQFTGLEGWLRICSFSGEPKNLAATTGFVAVLVLSLWKYWRISGKWLLVLFYFLISTTLLTLSTGGIILMFLLLLLLLLLNLFISRKKIRFLRASILIPIATVGSAVFFYKDFLLELLQLRFLDRLSSAGGGGIEDFDTTIIAFLSNNQEWLLFGSGWGNIHSLAYPYIPAQFASYMDDRIFIAKSGYLQLISENGLIGFSLFCIFQLALIVRLYSFRKIHQVGLFLFSMNILGFIAYMIRADYVIYEYLFIVGLSIGFLQLVRKKNAKI